MSLFCIEDGKTRAGMLGKYVTIALCEEVC